MGKTLHKHVRYLILLNADSNSKRLLLLYPHVIGEKPKLKTIGNNEFKESLELRSYYEVRVLF